MAEKKGVKFLTDAEGNRVKVKDLKENIVESHFYAEAVAKKYVMINEAMQREKNDLEQMCSEHLQRVAELAGLDHYEGFAVDYTYDKRYKVETREVEMVAFDTGVGAGVERLRKWLGSLQNNTNRKIMAIVNKILKVKSSGSISKTRLMELCSFDFDDEEYQEIKQVITSAMHVIDKKRYTNVYKRDEDGGWEVVKVSMASL